MARGRRQAAGMCCSKKILVASFTVAIALSLCVVAGELFMVRDMTQVTIIAGAAWGVVAVAVGFYYWKARAENRIKLAKNLVEDLAGEYGAETAVQLAQIALPE